LERSFEKVLSNISPKMDLLLIIMLIAQCGLLNAANIPTGEFLAYHVDGREDVWQGEDLKKMENVVYEPPLSRDSEIEFDSLEITLISSALTIPVSGPVDSSTERETMQYYRFPHIRSN